MARYDREFLVPYLESICALELAKRKLENQIDLKNRSILQCRNKAHIEKPEQFEHRYTGGCGCLMVIPWFFGILGCIAIFEALGDIAKRGFEKAMEYRGGTGMMLFVGVITIASIGLIIYDLMERQRAREDNELIDQENQEAMTRYEESLQVAYAVSQMEINKIEKKIASLRQEQVKLSGVLNVAYSANIIPRQYRNVYVAVYLYDWFSSSQADDLDLALNMFVLEEIKEKLDRIIQNQMEQILNQRVMMANQQKAMEQAERHNARLMAKLNRIEASNEERNMYLGMIEANTAANAYFSAANYLKN